jgi:hypothetical protein
MAMKEQQRQVYRTARGTEIDMGKLVQQNELTVAVGNAKVNARGDKLGPNGEIIKRREDIIAENNSQVVPNQLNVRVEETPMLKPVTVQKDVNGMDPEGNEEL